jgi:hypothetical protein
MSEESKIQMLQILHSVFLNYNLNQISAVIKVVKGDKN